MIGESQAVQEVLNEHQGKISDVHVENDRRNSAIPMLDISSVNARIEPGALIRDRVEIGDKAVIMMGAIINIGASIGESTMIDMGAILGARATVGKHAHISVQERCWLAYLSRPVLTTCCRRRQCFSRS